VSTFGGDPIGTFGDPGFTFNSGVDQFTDDTQTDEPEGDGMANFIHNGDAVDHRPAADVAAGQVVVQGDLVGVAKTAIAANALGALATRGVFDFPKGSGAISAGAVLYWDSAASEATTTASGNTRVGKAVAAAGASGSTVRALLAP